jgi:hypothetical protein
LNSWEPAVRQQIPWQVSSASLINRRWKCFAAKILAIVYFYGLPKIETFLSDRCRPIYS